MNMNEWKTLDSVTDTDKVYVTAEGARKGLGAAIRKRIIKKEGSPVRTQCQHSEGVHTWCEHQQVEVKGKWQPDTTAAHSICQHRSRLQVKVILNKTQREQLSIDSLRDHVSLSVINYQDKSYTVTKANVRPNGPAP